MAKLTKAAARAELKRRKTEQVKGAKKPWDPHAILYADQLAVFDDPTPDRILVGTRRLGKSYLAAVALIDAALTHPGSESAYVDLSIDHSEKVIARIIRDLVDEYDVPAQFVDGHLRADNGAVVYLFSGQPSEIEKLQGMKFALLLVDEAQDAGDLTGIITMCRPALIDFGGRVLAMGIPGRMRGIGPWWELTEGKAASAWGQHRGDMRRNPHLPPESLARQIAAAKVELGETSPDFLRHWLGLWPSENNALRVFRYLPDRNGYDPGEAPACKFHSLGLDPGGVSSCEAVVVVGHGNPDGKIFALDEDVSEPREGGGYDNTGERVGPLNEKWRCERRFYDYGSANKSALTLRYLHDQLILMDAVPAKDREGEINRINRLFEQVDANGKGRLMIPRGSKLERCLLYACWDPKTLVGGKTPDYDAPTKKNGGPNEADALRAAMWGVDGYVAIDKPTPPVLTEAQREQAELDAAFAPKTKTTADRYQGLLPARIIGQTSRSPHRR